MKRPRPRKRRVISGAPGSTKPAARSGGKRSGTGLAGYVYFNYVLRPGGPRRP
jgi:hypothetical protein